MAIDTRQRRMSAMNPGCPWRGPMVDASEVSFSAANRAAAVFLYSGIQADYSPPGVPSNTESGGASYGNSVGGIFSQRPLGPAYYLEPEEEPEPTPTAWHALDTGILRLAGYGPAEVATSCNVEALEGGVLLLAAGEADLRAAAVVEALETATLPWFAELREIDDAILEGGIDGWLKAEFRRAARWRRT